MPDPIIAQPSVDLTNYPTKDEVNTLAAQQLTAMQQAVPQPAQNAPPLTGPISAKGAVTRYALEDHTHEERFKWVATNLTTNSSGVWTGTLPANRFRKEPAVFCNVKTPSGSYDYRATVSGAASSGFSITVTFTKRKNSIDISLGALIGISLLDTTGIVTFDIACGESEL